MTLMPARSGNATAITTANTYTNYTTTTTTNNNATTKVGVFPDIR